MSGRLFLLVSSPFCPNLTAAPHVTSFKPAPKPTPTFSFVLRQSKLLQTDLVSTKGNTHSSAVSVPVSVSVSDPQCPKHLLVHSRLVVHVSSRCLVQPTSSCYLQRLFSPKAQISFCSSLGPAAWWTGQRSLFSWVWKFLAGIYVFSSVGEQPKGVESVSDSLSKFNIIM